MFDLINGSLFLTWFLVTLFIFHEGGHYIYAKITRNYDKCGVVWPWEVKQEKNERILKYLARIPFNCGPYVKFKRDTVVGLFSGFAFSLLSYLAYPFAVDFYAFSIQINRFLFIFVVLVVLALKDFYNIKLLLKKN